MTSKNDYCGADAVISFLSQAGIELCFANPGTTEMWFVKSLAKCSKIKTVLGLHETVCSGASDGYARMSRKPALCLLHMGPGLANAISNLHNAKRARSPVLVLVGDMAQWHMSSEAPLCMDIKSLAETVSSSVIIPSSINSLTDSVLEACKEATAYADEPLKSRVSTLIVPHNISWERLTATDTSGVKLPDNTVKELSGRTIKFLDKCIERIQTTSRGKVAFIIGGIATHHDGEALTMLGKIAAKISSPLYCENSFARLDRGCGLPFVCRLPYFPNDAVQELKQYSLIVAVDCRLPVAQFGYEDGPSEIISLNDEDIWQIDSGELTLNVIQYLHRCLNAGEIVPGRNCNGLFIVAGSRPPLPVDGALTPSSMCAVIARLQPESAIVVDESITSGGQYWELSKGCPFFTHLTLTGGAIGCGPAVSVGAALACPGRLVINIQADGSALYSLQAFWTQAKEKLNIVTVVCSNRAYAILKIEVGKQGIRNLHGTELGTLTDISKPEIDWVQVARGMGVKAARASTVKEFAEHLTDAISNTGPFLIEAIL